MKNAFTDEAEYANLIWTGDILNYTKTALRVALVLVAAAAIGRSEWQDEGKQAFGRMCFDCHGMEMIRGSGQSKAEWQDTVSKMVGRGARGSDEEIELVVEYLAENFPPPKINVNTESASDLRLDLDISRKAALGIVAYRESHGKIKSMEELKQIPDVDAAKLDAKKDRIEF